MEALERAVQIAGSQAALAELIGKKQAHVAMWIRRGKVPAEVCADIEAATNRVVRREELRPDVFRVAPVPAEKPRRASRAAQRRKAA